MKIENLCINCMREMKSQTGVCEHCGFDERKYDFPQHHMRPFTILAGKYLIGKAIGEGGFGITYIGIDLELEARVAIKEYYPQGAAARDSRTNDGTVRSYSENTRTFFEEGREKFINEARTIAKFRELPEIVGVIEFFRENQTAYIVMEYLDGQTLKQYLKANGGKIPADELLRMMKPLISSLGKVHSQGLIHRDISPDNIMLMKDGSIKILDFGGARDFISQNGKSLSVMVKHGYAPEEQYRSHGDQGPWTDVYALCATMYRCITGKIPPEALDRLYQDELKPIFSFNVACPKYIEKAITKGLSVRKDGRYQSMEELYDALYKGNPPKPPEPPKPKNNKTKLIIAAAAAAAIGIAVIAGVGIKMKQSDEKVVVKAVATPTQSVKDEITVTPTPISNPTPTQGIVQTASQVNIIKQNATYYVTETFVGVYVDCDVTSDHICAVRKGKSLQGTGVSEDGKWVEVVTASGKTGYIKAQNVSTMDEDSYNGESATGESWYPNTDSSEYNESEDGNSIYYDEIGRLWAYDENGNRIVFADDENRNLTAYDEYGNPIALEYNEYGNPIAYDVNGTVIVIAHDVNRNIIFAADDGNGNLIAYDENGDTY